MRNVERRECRPMRWGVKVAGGVGNLTGLGMAGRKRPFGLVAAQRNGHWPPGKLMHRVVYRDGRIPCCPELQRPIFHGEDGFGALRFTGAGAELRCDAAGQDLLERCRTCRRRVAGEGPPPMFCH